MASRIRFGRFQFQVRLVLVLLVLFLATLDLMNLHLLREARDDLGRSEAREAELRARQLVQWLGAEALVAAVRPDTRGAPIGSSALRRGAGLVGFTRVVLLDRQGLEVASTAPATRSGPSGLGELSPREWEALAAGRPVSGGVRFAGGGEDAELTTFLPLLDSSARLVGLLELERPVPELGVLQRRFRLLLAVQVIGVLVIAGLALSFANWVSRPYRRLADTAGAVGLTPGDSGAPEPDELAEAFRAVAAKLEEQDEALAALKHGAEGLAGLVRFALLGASNMSTGVLVLDEQGRVAAINPAGAALLGCDPARSAGRELAEVGAGVPGLQVLLRDCLERGASASREVLEIAPGAGRRGHLGVALSPSRAPDGQVDGALVLMTDLTEIRRLQEHSRLRESLATVGELSAGIAHEFRNALATILGYARMLEKREEPEVRDRAREILREVHTVRQTLDEFLLYARPPEPQRVPVELEPLIRSCAAEVSERLELQVQGEFGRVTGDEELLRRAFRNLLQNAVDAAAESGRPVRVRVTGRSLSDPAVAQIEIDDDGPGIPAEQRAQVFVPFFTTRARGTGLGLALVQRTVIDLGGEIDAAEGPRGGALFRIRLPRIEEGRASGEAPADERHRATGSV